jgi:type III pantothenate kinase
MQLVVDIGNTRIKVALFQKNELKHFFMFGSFAELLTASFFAEHTITHCIVASVVNVIDHEIEQLKLKVDSVLLFTNKTLVPIENKYESAATLGSDRLAAAIGGNLLFANQNILVIDCGTCIKYNFVNKNNQYLGGAISPGLQMRFKALHTFTARLPLVEADYNFNELVGKTTQGSILAGVQIAVTAEVDGMINTYKQEFSDIKVILTGGDVNFFEKRLKNSIFADQFLIVKGLNAILEYNK